MATDLAIFGIGIDARGAKSGAAQADQAFRRVEGGAGKATSRINRMQTSMNRTGRAAMNLRRVLGGLFVGITAGLVVRKAFRTLVDFESGLIGVAKTANLTSDEMEDLAKNVTKLSLSAPLATDHLLEMAQVAGQLGIRGTADLTKFATTMVKLESATDGLFTGRKAASELAGILFLTKTPFDQVDRLASSMVELGNTTNATEDQISEVALRVARATQQFKLTAAEVVGLADAFAILKIESARAGSATSFLFNAIQRAATQGGQQFDVLSNLLGGASQGDIAERFQSDRLGLFIDVLEQISHTGFDAIGVFEGLEIAALRGGIPLANLAAKFEEVRKVIERSKTAWDENIALQEEFDRRADSMQGSLDNLRNAFRAVVTEQRDNNDIIKKSIDGLAEAVKFLGGVTPESALFDNFSGDMIAKMLRKVEFEFDKWFLGMSLDFERFSLGWIEILNVNFVGGFTNLFARISTDFGDLMQDIGKGLQQLGAEKAGALLIGAGAASKAGGEGISNTTRSVFDVLASLPGTSDADARDAFMKLKEQYDKDIAFLEQSSIQDQRSIIAREGLPAGIPPMLVGNLGGLLDDKGRGSEERNRDQQEAELAMSGDRASGLAKATEDAVNAQAAMEAMRDELALTSMEIGLMQEAGEKVPGVWESMSGQALTFQERLDETSGAMERHIFQMEAEEQAAMAFQQNTEGAAAALAKLMSEFDKVEGERKSLDELARRSQRVERGFQAMGNTIAGAFERAIFAGDGLKDVFRGLLMDMAQMIIRAQIMRAIGLLAGAAGGGPLGAVVGGLFGAQGAIISRPNFAGGAVFNRPTDLPLANGVTGRFGEAGKEAILPLTQMPGGGLGVESVGGGGGDVIQIEMPITIVADSVDGLGLSSRQAQEFGEELADNLVNRLRR